MAYGVFAEFYDELTQNVDYGAKADYLCKIFDKFGHKTGYVLDLACGTGTLTIELKKRGIDIYGADSSFEMLAEAQHKAEGENLDILFICQKMQSLNLYGTINTCVCTLDSINHLNGKAQVQKAFDKVSDFMEKDGLFVFDVNTLHKHRSVLGNNTFVYDTDSVYCVWQNTFDDRNYSVQIDLDFFIPDGEIYFRSSESFKEYAYSVEEIETMLNNSGFDVLDFYNDMTFLKPVDDLTQRITFVAKKRYNTDEEKQKSKGF